jgi:hypothetical protein
VRRNVKAIEHDKDDFLTAFWSGYALQGYDRPVTHSGTLVRVEGNVLVMRRSQSEDEQGHRLAADFKVIINRKKAKLEDLVAGMTVRITTNKDDKTVTRVDVRD